MTGSENASQQTARFDLTSLLLALLLPALGRTQTSIGTQPLKLLISLEQESITGPFPARLTLHLHNSGECLSGSTGTYKIRTRFVKVLRCL